MMMSPLPIIFVLMILSTSDSQNVTNNTLEESCTNMHPPLTAGWHMECKGYQIDYLIDQELTVTCTKFLPPYTPAMFVPYNIAEIKLFRFVECPPPNTSFAEALSGMKVVWLEYEVNQHIIDLESTLFDGLPDLQVIVLNVTTNGMGIPVDIFWRLSQLVSLSMATELDSVPENLFANLTSLQSLSILKNTFTTLPKDIFSPLGTLTSLVLDNGALQELPAEIFDTLTKLQTLSLRNNQLSKILPSDINQLSNLTSFYISGNLLEELDPDLFQGNLNLETIDLGYNPTLPSLPYNLLQNLTYLKNLTIMDCNFTDIPDTFFSYASNLERIFMQDNRLKNISSIIFSNNAHLKEIDLWYNDVVIISVDAFANLFELEWLRLAKTNVAHLPQGLFDKNINLVSFDVSDTNLTYLPGDLFQNLVNVKTLNFRNNILQSVQGNAPFGPGQKLESLDLSLNNLTGLSLDWELYPHLAEINLEYNVIYDYSLPIIKTDHTSILLDHNFIQTVSVDDLKHFDDTVPAAGKTITVTFSMIKNKFVCDCQMLKFAQFINDSIYLTQFKFYTFNFHLANQYVCEQPPNLYNRALIYLDKTEFVCGINESCPESCDCYIRGFDDATVVNCTARGLTNLPITLPFNTTELYFSQNKLASLNSSAWMNITLLDVSENEIKANNWTLPSTLTELRLQGNRMTWVPLSVQALIETNSNARLYLGNNPFPCNCSMRDLRVLLSLKANCFPDLYNIYCTNDKQSVKRNLIDVSESELCPSEGLSGTLIFVVALLVILSILLPVGLVAYYKNKRIVLAFLYTRLNGVFSVLFDEEELDENKTYDAFISYSSLNEDIAQALLEELENKDVFRLCIHGRDWLPGNLIVDNISMSVQSSRRTILVVSKDFLESIWFQVEFHTAYYQMLEDKMDRLIIIIQGDLPERGSLDEDLQVLLSTKTYLVWGENWFWEKLKYAMPHKKQKRRTVTSNMEKQKVSLSV